MDHMDIHLKNLKKYVIIYIQNEKGGNKINDVL